MLRRFFRRGEVRGGIEDLRAGRAEVEHGGGPFQGSRVAELDVASSAGDRLAERRKAHDLPQATSPSGWA